MCLFRFLCSFLDTRRWLRNLFLSLSFPVFAGSAVTIGIFTCKVGGPWDPESIRSGITGSEEAVIYISQKLADLGYQVEVLGSPPKDSPHSRKEANPRYIDID